MLKEYTVLDFTDDRGEIGPMLLGDLGADVIRVELPVGSAARQNEPRFQDSTEGLKSLQYVAFNRNKRSILLDPLSEDDLQTLDELIIRADFIFESSPSNILSAYKIGYAAAKKLNDRIIYISGAATPGVPRMIPVVVRSHWSGPDDSVTTLTRPKSLR